MRRESNLLLCDSFLDRHGGHLFVTPALCDKLRIAIILFRSWRDLAVSLCYCSAFGAYCARLKMYHRVD